MHRKIFFALAAGFFAASLHAQTTGIGVALQRDSLKGTWEIIQVDGASPAEAAGLRARDQPISVDGRSISRLSLEDALAAVNGGGKTSELELTYTRYIRTSFASRTDTLRTRLTPAVLKKFTCILGDCTNGEGTLQYADGRKAVGKFKNGEFKEGVIYRANGRMLAGGTFKDLKLHGPSCRTFNETEDRLSDGAYVDGKIVSGTLFYREPEGYGYSITCDHFDEQGLCHGKGTLYAFKDYRRTEGDFVHGVAEGYANSSALPNGEGYWQGPMKAGLPHGKGKIYHDISCKRVKEKKVVFEAGKRVE